MGALYRDLVRKHSKAKGSARAVLNILADYATDDGLAWPGRAVLANDAGMSERNVIRCIQKLCADGRLIIEGNAVGGRGKVPVYRIVFADCEKGDSLSLFNDDKRVTNEHIKGDNLSIKGDKSAPIQSYVRSEPQEPIKKPKRKKEIAPNGAPPSPPVAVPVKEKPEPTEWQEFVGALCWLCHGHKEVNVLKREQKLALVSEAKTIKADDYSIDDLREWYKTVWRESWQYKKNSTSRPTPADVRSAIAQLRAETPEGFEVAPVLNVNGNNTNNGTTAIMDFVASKGMFQ